MIVHPHNLTKEERLCSKKLINELFINGRSFNIDYLNVRWLVLPTPPPAPPQLGRGEGVGYSQLLISISSHKIKKAVQRNKIKRQIREAFRKNKTFYYDFLKQNNKQTVLAIICNSKELLPYSEIEAKIILILQRLILLINNE